MLTSTVGFSIPNTAVTMVTGKGDWEIRSFPRLLYPGHINIVWVIWRIIFK